MDAAPPGTSSVADAAALMAAALAAAMNVACPSLDEAPLPGASFWMAAIAPAAAADATMDVNCCAAIACACCSAARAA